MYPYEYPLDLVETES